MKLVDVARTAMVGYLAYKVIHAAKERYEEHRKMEILVSEECEETNGVEKVDKEKILKVAISGFVFYVITKDVMRTKMELINMRRNLMQIIARLDEKKYTADEIIEIIHKIEEE